MGRILVVDDDNTVRQMICDALELAGHEVVDANNGDRALERFAGGVFDLVITDIVMPEKEGLETIIELRGINPDVAILAISGGGSFVPGGYLRSALMLGADKALEKPFSIQLLMETVEGLLARPTALGAATVNGAR